VFKQAERGYRKAIKTAMSTTQSSLFQNSLPMLPRLVLRVGFAGNRELTADARGHLAGTLSVVFQSLAQLVAEIAPGTPDHGPVHKPQVSQFYSQEPPLLRLITGLAEGADAIAAETLVTMGETTSPSVTELAAVLPVRLTTYRASRDVAFLAKFDELANRCRYILSLDGHYAKPDPDTKEAKNRRLCRSGELRRPCSRELPRYLERRKGFFLPSRTFGVLETAIWLWRGEGRLGG
jgi:hypothetical protein